MRLFFIRWLVAILVSPGLCFAQAVPTRMQSTISGIIQQKMSTRGFSSNDPRWGATLQSAGSTIVGAAAAAAVVTIAGVTAPAWITAAATVALTALFAAGIDLAIDGVHWMLNSDGSVTASSSGGSSGLLPMTTGGSYWSASGYGNIILAGSATGAIIARQNLLNPDQSKMGACTGDASSYSCQFSYPGGGGLTAIGAIYFDTGAPMSCAGGTADVNSVCVSPTVSASTSTVSASAAVAQLSAADSAKPINPAVTAAIADAAWKTAAAQPGYTGVPYDAADPITAADASTYQSAHPSSTPTVGDAVSPQTAPSGGSAASPFTLPNSAAAPALAPGATPAVNAPTSGIDWAIPATGDSIPTQAVPVTYTPTIFTSATGCPSPISFVMMGKSYAISYQPACDLMTTLSSIFLACGAAAAALIFAEALKS